MSAAEATTPRHLLLATDLSARCDRARDRALALARAWSARLTVVHALESLDVPGDHSSRPPVSEAAIRATRLLHADFAELKDVDIALHVGEGRPENVVLDTAVAKGCDLIVTGIAGNDPLGQPLLGNTVASLTRRAPIPVLVVKKRPRGPYRGVTVASDLSEPSAAALETALRLFRPQDITLFHAFDMPFRNLIDDKPSYEHDRRIMATAEIKAFLNGVAGEETASRIRSVTFHGDPAPLIADHAAEEDTDLVIAGTHGRTGLMSILLGSAAIAILNEAPCDVMIVPSRGARTTA